MENVNNLIQGNIWNHTGSNMMDCEKDEISSQVIKKVNNLVSKQIMDQIRFTVWHQVHEEVKKNFRLLNMYSPAKY